MAVDCCIRVFLAQSLISSIILQPDQMKMVREFDLNNFHPAACPTLFHSCAIVFLSNSSITLSISGNELSDMKIAEFGLCSITY